MSGIIGGAIGYQLLRRLGKKASREGICDGSSYQDRSKLEVLFGAGIWDLLADKTVVDFGCGIGSDLGLALSVASCFSAKTHSHGKP